MYRNTGAGEDPVPPALLAMVVLLQSYLGTSDAEAVELAVVDLRWQMVLGCLGDAEPPFSQGALQGFRDRLIAHDLDRRLLERTVELARGTKEFDWKKLPKTLRVAIDSAPLEGAGRVEATLNLLAHAARKVVDCAADLLHWTPERVCREARAPLLLAPSIKAALDRDWSDPAQKTSAVKSLVIELENLKDWLDTKLREELRKPPLSEEVATLKQLMEQDLEPDPDGGGMKIREGVAEDRRVSVEDAEMRHGRKSKTKRFNGYKRHVRDRPRLGPHPLRRDHAGESSGGRSRARARRGHQAPGARDPRVLHRPRLREVAARRRDTWSGRRHRVQALGREGQGRLLEGGLQDQRARPHRHLPGGRDGEDRVRHGDGVRSRGV
jgi:hypothetical protein